MPNAFHRAAIPPSPAKATLERIATECGMSVQTVSRILRGTSKEVWPGMIERARRVREVAARLGYQPNAAARSMRSRRFHNLGYFVAAPSRGGVSHQDDEAGVCHGANAHDYHVSLIRLPVTMTMTPDAVDQAPSIPKALREACVDALIVANFMRLPPVIKDSIRASRLPTVYLNEDDPVNAVKVDDTQGARTMTRHLLEQGYRDVAYLEIRPTLDAPAHYSSRERQSGYADTMRTAGLPERTLLLDHANHERALETLLASDARPEAIFCYEDAEAMIVQRAARRAGVSVPRDFGLAAYNDDYSGHFSPVLLTTMAVPFFEMGVAAAEMAIALCQDDAPETFPSVVFTPQLVFRESTARAGSRG